jgi:ribose transport system substrate-binding protein
VVPLVLAAVLLLGACGSGAVRSSEPSSSGKIVTTALETSAGGSGYALAKARVAEFLKPPSSTLPVTTKVKVPSGKLNLAYTWCAQVVCATIATGVQQAAAALGAQFQAYHQVDTASTVSTAFTNALAANPSMVFTSGDPVQWFQSQLNQLNAKKIPVVGWSIPEAYHAPGFAANVITNDDYFFYGVLQADYVSVETNDNAHVLLESVPQYPVLATTSAGFEYEFKRACPKCTLTTDNFSVQQLIAGDNVAATVASLQKAPNTDWLVGTFGGLITPQVASAVKAAGFTKLKAIEASGTASNYQMIKTHNLDAADVALPSDYLGWLAVNDGLLALDGKKVPQFKQPANTSIPGHPDILVAGLPTQILTAADAPTSSAGYTPVPNFQAKFKALWGLG